MKKFLFIFLTSIIGVISVKAAPLSETFYYDTKVPDMYITTIKGSSMHNGAPHLLHKSDGTIVYCINPFEYVADTPYDGYYGYNPLFGLTEAQINRMNLVAKYGYGYGQHTSLKWYGVTQYLIWEALNLDDIYFTDSYYGNRISKYLAEINEINNLANNYGKLPSFQGKVYNFSIKNIYNIEDSNNVLSNYEISSSDDNLEVSIINNHLSIKALKEGSYTVTFTKKDNTHNYELYYSNQGQSLIFPGKVHDISTTITINAYKGKIEINKHDIERDTPYPNTTFKGAIYGLYKDGIDELVETISLDEEGKGTFDELQLTNYYVKEITAPIGYQLDDTKYSVRLTLNNKEEKIDVYDEVIKKDVLITKYYGNPITNTYYLESGAVFDLYDAWNNFLNTYTTDREGNILLNLTYGNYLLKQITSKDGYTINDDLLISINDIHHTLYDLYDYEIMDYGKLNIVKKGSDNKLLDGIEFELYADMDIMGKDGHLYYHKDDLITTLKTNNGLATYDQLLYGRYYLKEIKTSDGYQLSKDNYYFEVDEAEENITIINDKIIDEAETDIYVSVPNTGVNDIDYLETIGILMILAGYCLGLIAYNKMIGIH